MAMISAEILSELGNLDTPTICNAVEVVVPERRNRGFSTRPFFCAHPKLPPIVGYARTARIRSQHKPIKSGDAMGYYSYISEGGPVPSIVVIDDVDDMPGYGAFWGEVNTNVHYGLGCIGLIYIKSCFSAFLDKNRLLGCDMLRLLNDAFLQPFWDHAGAMHVCVD